MLIDIVVAVLLVLALVKGLRKGLILGIFSFLAFFIGLAAALKLSALAAGYLSESFNISGKWLPFVAFALVFLLVIVLVHLGAKALEGAVKLVLLGWLNKLGGVVLYAFLYLFIFSILLFYADQLQVIKSETKTASMTYGFLQPLGPQLIEALGAVIPWFKNMFGELTSFFDKVGQETPPAKP